MNGQAARFHGGHTRLSGGTWFQAWCIVAMTGTDPYGPFNIQEIAMVFVSNAGYSGRGSGRREKRREGGSLPAHRPCSESFWRASEITWQSRPMDKTDTATRQVVMKACGPRIADGVAASGNHGVADLRTEMIRETCRNREGNTCSRQLSL